MLETRNLLSTKPSAPAFITTSLTDTPKLFKALPMSNINPCRSQVIIVITFNPLSSSKAMVTNVSPIEAGTSSSLDEVDGASSSSASMVVVVVVVVLAVLVSMLLFCETLAKTG